MAVMDHSCPYLHRFYSTESGHSANSGWLRCSELNSKHSCFKKFHPKARNHGEGPYWEIAAFNQEKGLVEAFSVITNLQMDPFEALLGIYCKLFNSEHRRQPEFALWPDSVE